MPWIVHELFLHPRDSPYLHVIFIMISHTCLQGHVDPLLHPHSSCTSIFGILGSHFESCHFLHYLIGCHKVVIMPSLETLQICGLKWHKSTDILALDPHIINMRGTMIH